MASSVTENVLQTEKSIQEISELILDEVDCEKTDNTKFKDVEVSISRSKKITYTPCINEEDTGDQSSMPLQTVWKQPVVQSNESLKETEWPTPSVETDLSEAQKAVPPTSKKGVKAKQVWHKMEIKEEPKEINRNRQKYPMSNQNGFKRGTGRGRGSSMRSTAYNGSMTIAPSGTDPRLSIAPLVPRSTAPFTQASVSVSPISPKPLLSKTTSPAVVSATHIISNSESTTSPVQPLLANSKIQSDSSGKLLEERIGSGSHRIGVINNTQNNGHANWRQPYDPNHLELGPVQRAKRLQAKGRQTKYGTPYNVIDSQVNWASRGQGSHMEDGYTVPYLNQSRDRRPPQLFMQPLMQPLLPQPIPVSQTPPSSNSPKPGSTSPTLSDSGSSLYHIQREQVPLSEIDKLLHPDAVNPVGAVPINEGILPDKRLFTKLRHGMGIIFPTRRDYVLHFLEHYFSKENLTTDEFLRHFLIDGACPVSKLLEFPKLQRMYIEVDDIVSAVKDTDLMIIRIPNNGECAIRRKDGWFPEPISVQMSPMVTSPQPTNLMRPGAPLQNIFPGYQLIQPPIMVAYPQQSPTDAQVFFQAATGFGAMAPPFRFPHAQAWMPHNQGYVPQYMPHQRQPYPR